MTDSHKSEWRQKTVDTYNKSAKELAEYFRGIGSRTSDIDLAIQLAGNPQNLVILEIGCGDGRDAKEIIKHTASYTGIDISEKLIELARAYVPNAHFEVADAATYQYPSGIDVVFAFASLLHSDKAEVKDILHKVGKALNPGGICYISLKYAPEYTEKVKADKYGERLFYFYNPEVITELASDEYEVAKQSVGSRTIGDVVWFEIALRKK